MNDSIIRYQHVEQPLVFVSHWGFTVPLRIHLGLPLSKQHHSMSLFSRIIIFF